MLQQISATWENASITPGRKRATKFLLTQGLSRSFGLPFPSAGGGSAAVPNQKKPSCENETDVRATKRATPTNKNVLQIIVSPCESRATKISADSRPEAARKRFDGAGIGQRGRASRKTSEHSRTMIDFSCENRTTVRATPCATPTNENVLQIRVSADKARATNLLLRFADFSAFSIACFRSSWRRR